MRFRLSIFLFALLPALLRAQAPGVPVYREDPEASPSKELRRQARQLRDAGGLLSRDAVLAQKGRRTCHLDLPEAQTQKLDSRTLWQRARKAHIRLGWNYLCRECNHWHLDLSGGYAITRDCVATCAHVVDPGADEDMREGFFVAVDEENHVIPVVELLAVDRATDCAIVRLKTDALQPLPLTSNVFPGDQASCFSDPFGYRGVFSTGIVQRFVQRRALDDDELTPEERADRAKVASPVWVEVSDDWAPGSSGSAVLDACGNAIGHVSEVQAMLEDDPGPADDPEEEKMPGKPGDMPDEGKKEAPKDGKNDGTDADAHRPVAGTVMVMHAAIAASNVRALIAR